MNIQYLLLQRVHEALTLINTKSFLNLIQVQQSNHIRFGDYQINGMINISKHLQIPIKDFSNIFIKTINLKGIAKIIKFEPPGFINIFLSPTWIENKINHIIDLPKLGIDLIPSKNIVIDYSSPNIAKEMHVGHLRSTIIGDSIARILSFLGHNVIRSNHIGDWGTQFGMLIAYIKKHKINYLSLNDSQQISMLEYYYQESKKEYDSDPNFAELSRKYVVKLQKGDVYCRKIWKYLVDISISNNQKIYDRLNVTLKKKDIMGESMYHDMLPYIITDLKNKKLAVTSDHATIVFLNQNKNNKKNNPFGVIIQKKDGGYLYSTTDIACIKYRCETLHADRIIYYIDSRQKQHLMQAWEIAYQAGYITKAVVFEHHVCGMLLDKNKKPFKTRSGNTIKLITLLNEAFNKAYNLILNKNLNLEYKKINHLAHIISIGAIKYSELSKNRTTNYIFNWDKILNFDGNTAPYIQYAYTRISSIFKKINHRSELQEKKYQIFLSSQEEILLAICLLQFHETLITVADRGTPHILCGYLYKLSTLFSLFYEHCPILKTECTYTKYSRLKLAFITAQILKKGLNLLGIETSEYM